MLIASILSDVLDTIVSGIFKIFLIIDSFIYTLVNWIYKIIIVLADIRLFDSNSGIQLDKFVERIYIIIGVAMLFLLAYSLLKNMVNPDDAIKGKGSPTKLIANVVISLALMALVPTIFDFALDLQSSLLKRGTISGIILGNDGYAGETELNAGGFTIAKSVFQAFFRPKDSNECVEYNSEGEGIPSGCSETELRNGITYMSAWESMEKSQNFELLPSLSDYAVASEDQKIDYMWGISTVAGIFVLFVLVSYCIEIALRTIKLAVYQLIAPLPILARLLPNDQGKKVFDSWVKGCISTYAEVFIRLAILYFAILIIVILRDSALPAILSAFDNDAGIGISLIAFCFLILGVIYFVKDFPNIIKEMTGLDSGKYNVLGSAMDGFNKLRGITRIPVNSFNATEWDKNRPIRSAFNRLKNPLVDSAKFLTNTRAKDYKGMGDLNSTYKKSVNEILAERRRREEMRRGNQAQSNARRQIRDDVKENTIMEFVNSSEGAVIISQTGITQEELIELLKSKSGRAFNKGVKDLANKKYEEVYQNTFDEDLAKDAYDKIYDTLMNGTTDAQGNSISGARDAFFSAEQNAREAQNKQFVRDLQTNIAFWATGGVENLKARRDAIQKQQKLAAEILSNAKKEVEGNLQDYVDSNGKTLEELQIIIEQKRAELQAVTTRSYAKPEDKQKAEQAAVQSLATAQAALRDGVKFATNTLISDTMSGKFKPDEIITRKIYDKDGNDTGNTITYKFTPIAKLSGQLAEFDNVVKQTAGISEHNANSYRGMDDIGPTFEFKKFRNDLGSEIEKLDGEISAFMDIQNQKEGKK